MGTLNLSKTERIDVRASSAVKQLLQEAARSCTKTSGQALLKDALLRTAQAADMVGIRCLLVHAKDEAARQWYESWEFEPSPTGPYHLFLMLKDLKALLAG